MKCQRRDKPATFHITELTGGKPQELHLCEQHARSYLTESEPEQGSGQSLAGALGSIWRWDKRPKSSSDWISSRARFAASRSSSFARKGGWAARTTTSAFRRSWSR